LSNSAISMPDEKYAVTQLRSLRVKAEKSGKEIAKELRMWQDSLGHGKFKKNYLLAGWTEDKVHHYLQYYKEDAEVNSPPDVTENKEITRTEIQGLIYRVKGITAAIEQVLAAEKWQRDKDFPELQQEGKALISLLERL
jgi:hypothetical protein